MDVGEQLKALPLMEKPALCELWHDLFKKPAPNNVRKELMVRILAYRTQELVFGGLTAKNRRRLRGLAVIFKQGRKADLANEIPIKPGTRLIREWHGKTHQVTVGDSSYEYDGRRFTSLSEIARRITGTRWSGPLFFGLKNRRRQGVVR